MLRALQRRHKGLGRSDGPKVVIKVDSVCEMTGVCGGHKGPNCDSGETYAIRVSDYIFTTSTKNPSLSIRKPDELQICVCLSGACCCRAIAMLCQLLLAFIWVACFFVCSTSS